MLKLGSIYLKTKNINNSIEFYSKLLEMVPSARNKDRWAQFDFHGKCIALWNPLYDEINIGRGEATYSDAYIEYYRTNPVVHGNNMVLNFYVDDLKTEYKRVQSLSIGAVTPIMSIDVSSPYHMFVLKDPDGNEIEVTGNL